jgi:beta-ribofuranosylaminobenzene 5'-phosphate synthase
VSEAGDAVFVEAAARLHFGVLDLRGSLGRWFGGIGASAPGPSLLVSASHAGDVGASGPDLGRALEAAMRVVDHYELEGAHVHVHRALPPHSGLGSGTQLALAVGRAIATLHGIDGSVADAPTLARIVGRTRRSAIGTWTFDGGGLVLEGGRRRDGGDGGAPLLARIPFPPSWRCVVAIPEASPGISGAQEAVAFAELPVPPERDVERVAHLVLMGLLPAVAEGDVTTFGRSLTEIQRITGDWFAAAQGGTYAPGPGAELIARMAGWGAAGVGQSSWGPAVYAIVDGAEVGGRLADRVRDSLGGAGLVFEGPFQTSGARVWREPIAG